MDNHPNHHLDHDCRRSIADAVRNFVRRRSDTSVSIAELLVWAAEVEDDARRDVEESMPYAGHQHAGLPRV